MHSKLHVCTKYAHRLRFLYPHTTKIFIIFSIITTCKCGDTHNVHLIIYQDGKKRKQGDIGKELAEPKGK